MGKAKARVRSSTTKNDLVRRLSASLPAALCAQVNGDEQVNPTVSC